MAFDDTNYWLRLRRRQLLKGAAFGAIGGAGMLVVGCSSSKKSTTPSATAAAGTAPASVTSAGSPTEAPGQQVAGYHWYNKPDLTLTPKPGGILTFGTPIQASGLDPVTSNSYESANIYTPCYSGLTRAKFSTELDPYNPWQLVVEPDLATAWETPSPGQVNLTIRQGVVWHDLPPVNGRPFTADDVVYSLQQYAAQPALNVFMPIESVSSPDAQTVTVKLKTPINYLPQALAENRIMMVAKEVADRNKVVIGTGAFILTNYVPGTSATYKKNVKYYRPGFPYLDGMEFSNVTFAAALSAFISGKYALMRGDGISSIKTVLQSVKDTVVLEMDSRWQSNIFHVAFKYTNPPYNDPRVLQAISKGWDRDTFGKNYFTPTSLPPGKPYSVLGPYAWTDWFDSAPDLGDNYKFDPTAAKQLLSAAGHTSLDVPIQFTSFGSQSLPAMLQFMKAQLQQVGVNIILQEQDFATFEAEYFTGKFKDGVLGFTPTFPRYAPAAAISQFKSNSGSNYYSINDSTIDSALDTMTTSTDNAEVRSAFQTFWKTLLGHPYLQQDVEGQTDRFWAPQVHNILPNMYHDWAGWGNQAMEVVWMDQ